MGGRWFLIVIECNFEPPLPPCPPTDMKYTQALLYARFVLRLFCFVCLPHNFLLYDPLFSG